MIAGDSSSGTTLARDLSASMTWMTRVKPAYDGSDVDPIVHDQSPRLPHRSRHRRVARHRLCHRAGAGQSRRACHRGGANARRPRRTRRRHPQRRRQRDAGAAQPHRLRRHRAARRGAARAPWQARHPGRQCRRRRPVVAARPYRAEAVERRDGRQRHREFSADPLHGAVAQSNPMPAARCSSPRAPPTRPRPISAPTRRRKRRWKRWCGPGPTKPHRRRSGSTCSIPARSAPGCAPSSCPAKIR